MCTRRSRHRAATASLAGILAILLPCLLAAAEDIPRGLLPRTAVPIAYRLDLTIDPEKSRFSGLTQIDIDIKTPTRMLYLHGRDLSVTRATITVAGKQQGISFKQLDEQGTARVDFDAELPAGPATLAFEYDASFGDGPAGLYRIKVAGEWYSWTQFESIDARAAFPSFDEPGFKTPFTVSLTTRSGLLALSNMPESALVATHDGLVRHTFLPTPPLPTYLLAFVVGPFITAEGAAPATSLRNHPLPLRIVATRNQSGRLDYALRETTRIVELLENYFGQSFPFPKLDQIASPVMPGAMENAGADIYGDNILLLDEGASTQQKQTFGMVVAHELSHQWFGDFVTPAWWDDIWLNESFANWMGYRIGNEWRPELNIGVNAIGEALAAMASDSLAAGRPIRQVISDSSEADSTFDGITYGKGGQIIAMIAAYLGDDKFREGVRLHLRRRPYGSATSSDFFGALAEAAGEPQLIAAMRSFVEQQGMPVVDLVPSGRGYRATQSRFLQPGSVAPEQTWVIPFCVRLGADTSCSLLDGKEKDLRLEGAGPLVPNAGGTGYYRYRLTPADWDALLNAGKSLSAGEALAASDSLWAQVSSARLPPSKLIDAARSFAGHVDSNVAVDGGTKLAALRRRGVIGRNNDDYRKVMSATYGRKLHAMGFDPRAAAHALDSADLQKQRQELVALVAEEARDPVIRGQLAHAAQAWLDGDAKSLDQAFYSVALQVHVQQGSLATTRALFERLLADTTELSRRAELEAVASSGRKADARWLIEQFGDPRLRPTDRLALMSRMMSEPDTRDQAFKWLRSNYDEFSRRMGIFAVREIPTLPGGYCSEADARMVEAAILPKVMASRRGESPLRRMLEGIRSCGVLRKSMAAELATALKQAATTL